MPRVEPPFVIPPCFVSCLLMYIDIRSSVDIFCLTNHTVSSIASTGFGLEANTFDGSPQGEQFYKMTRKLMGADNSQWKNFVMFMIVAKMCPRWVGKMLKVEQVDRESTGENVMATSIMKTTKLLQGMSVMV